MQTRRKFLSRAAGLSAAAFTASSAAPVKEQIKKSILISMLPKELSYLDQFKLAVDIGFHEMEVRTVDSNDEAVKIKKAADQAGLRIHSVMNQAHWRYPLSSPDPKEVQASMQGMELSLNQAELYGADAVLLVPAVVRGDTTYEQAWERSQKKIRELLPLAEKSGVIIAIEEVWNKFLLTARDFVQYIDEFNNPARASLRRRRQHGSLRRAATLDPADRQAHRQGPSEGLRAPDTPIRQPRRGGHQLGRS